MSEQLLDLLKLGLLALLYLFFIRVIWAVWTDLRSPTMGSRPSTDQGFAVLDQKPAQLRFSAGSVPQLLRVIEPLDSEDTSYPLVPEMTLGRAAGCAVVIDDTYVSQIHARVFADGDDYRVEDLGSTNGTFLNGDSVSTSLLLSLGDRIQVGKMVLEVA